MVTRLFVSWGCRLHHQFDGRLLRVKEKSLQLLLGPKLVSIDYPATEEEEEGEAVYCTG